MGTEHQNHSSLPISINAAAKLLLKLNFMNFPSWQIQLTLLLVGYDLQGYLTGNTLCPEQMIQFDNKQSVNPTYTFWQRQDKFLLHAIVASVTESIVRLIATAKTSQDAWEKLEKMFASKTRSRIMSLKKKLTISHKKKIDC